MTHQYVAGICNIGPDEIALRRRVGHVGVATTAALAAALIQARQRFCADLGWRGVYNFDRRGQEQPVTGNQDLARDRRRALQIAATSGAIGLGVAVASMLA